MYVYNTTRTPHSIEDNTYEVTIGVQAGNQQVIQIKRQVAGEVIKKKARPNWILAKEFRDFWISWTKGTIRIGTGRVFGVAEQLNYTDPNPYLVTAVSLDTASNADVTWQFDRDAGRPNGH